MRDTAHLDGREHGIANGSVFQKSFGRANRLVVAHVLINSERDAGVFAKLHCFQCFAIVHAERFLGEDALDGAARTGRFDQAELCVGRDSDVEHFNGSVVQELLVACVDFFDAVAVSHFLGVLAMTRGNCDWIEASFAVGDEVAIIHDEAAAEDPDAKILPPGQGRMNVQVHRLQDVVKIEINRENDKNV